jgi:hypothetical protein
MSFVCSALDHSGGSIFYGAGHSPQTAWNDLLEESGLDQEDFDMDSVEFFEKVDGERVTRFSEIRWVLDEESEMGW